MTILDKLSRVELTHLAVGAPVYAQALMASVLKGIEEYHTTYKTPIAELEKTLLKCHTQSARVCPFTISICSQSNNFIRRRSIVWLVIYIHSRKSHSRMARYRRSWYVMYIQRPTMMVFEQLLSRIIHLLPTSRPS